METKDTVHYESLTEAAKRLAETRRSLLLDLLNPAFMSRHSQSPDFITFCESAGYDVHTIEDFESVADEQWDAFVAAHTDFADWADMQAGAVAAQASEQLLKVVKG
ncbi:MULTISPECIES: hypothetical protein [unclassified Pseudomonas]|jgi:hypothetical protein|uniref:hypothetical protein n=1 Tax=unclassified Pseudomonas TaxID=196821 RepID=UPI002555F02B|nr:hypothetical protein [Pseudomonas sp. efr-133-TYG-103a]